MSHLVCDVGLNAGDGTFTAGTPVDLPETTRGRIALADVDGDQDLDLDLTVATLGNQLSLRLNDSTNPVPVITSFTPGSGLAGTQVVIMGANLLNIVSASFNGMPVTLANVTNNASTSITLVAPSSGSTGPIAVTTAGGTGISAQSFTYLVPATLSVDALSASSYCAASSISIPFMATGSYAPGFDAYKVQLNGSGRPSL